MSDVVMTNGLTMAPSEDAPNGVSVVIPAKDEALNLPDVIDEIAAALAGEPVFEILVVDDGSADDTQAVLTRLAASRPWLRRIRHAQACGKSAAVATGVRAARWAFIVTVDGDGQNDPRYISALLAPLRSAGSGVGVVAGQRLKRGDDGAIKRWASRIANGVRGRMLGDMTRDTACGLKAFRRDLFLRMPYFDTMHRFLPALALREGFGVAHVDVIDRVRRHGVSKYGIFDRLLVGAPDLFGVWWLKRRRRRIPLAAEVTSYDEH